MCLGGRSLQNEFLLQADAGSFNATCSVFAWRGKESFVFDSKKFGMGDSPFLIHAATTKRLIGMHSSESAPLPHGVRPPAENSCNLARRVEMSLAVLNFNVSRYIR